MRAPVLHPSAPGLCRNLPLALRLAATSLALALCTAGPARASLAQLLSPAESPATAPKAEPKPASAAEQQAQIRQALLDAQAERERTGAPPAGITRQEQEERVRLLDHLINRLTSQLELFAEREEVKRALAATEQRAKNWTGFAQAPPYSVLYVDRLRSQLQDARSRVNGLVSTRELFARQIGTERETIKRAQEKERLASEAFEQAQSADARAVAAWRRAVAGLRIRAAEATAAWGALRYEVLGERLGVAQAEQDFLARQVAEARKALAFTRADLNQALASLTTARAELEQELNAALARNNRSVSELSGAQQALDSVLSRPAASSESRRRALEQRQHAAQAWVESTRFEIEVLSALLTVNQAVAGLWEQRYAATVGSDAEQRRSILAEFRKSREQLGPWLEYAQQQVKSSQTAERQQEARLALAERPDAPPAAERDLLAAKRRQRELAERLQSSLEQLNDTLLAWQEEFTLTRQERTLGQQLSDSGAWLSAIAGKVWTFELLAVEDTVEVAGQTVVTSRGVTVGKSVGALLLFLFGYWLAALLARGVQRVMVSRFRVGEHQADVIRRWLLALTTFILLMVTLNLARIPLTVFAFFGGALAIGVGFGTQTLIKNLISGIMILLERKVQVGDTVEVDGVIGKVTAVDFRASTVLGFDGVETVIPNSSFLENKVTNWTYTHARLRREIRVGVAYGSPVERVRTILAECGARHPLILKEPPPQVFFENFGDNSLIFLLHFWIDFGAEVNPLQVASDLRFMIEERFAREQISVAFPQRDVHLDSAKPLRVEVVAAPGQSRGTDQG